MRTIIGKSLGILFAVLLIFISFVTSFEYVCYHQPDLYRKEIEKYQVQAELEYWRGETMEEDALENVFRQTMSYLRGNRENLIVETEISGHTEEFYNENEKSHMADVKVLFVGCLFFRALANLAVLAIAGYLIISVGARKAGLFLSEGFIYTSLAMIVAVVGISLLAASNFTKYFTIFHEIFFSQGNWMFDPRQSRMIDIMPEGLFSDFALWISETFLGVMAALLVGASFLRRKFKNPSQENVIIGAEL